MKIKATVTFEYTLNDSEIEEFKSRVIERVEEEVDEGVEICVTFETVKAFLNEKIPELLRDSYDGYGYDSGLVCDDYFNTITFDYCGEGISDLVEEFANQIIAEL